MSGSSGAEPLGPGDRHALLAFARRSIEAALLREPKPAPPERAALQQPRAAFVTLTRKHDRELRGCIGLLRTDTDLAQIVGQCAVAAALADRRFEPVTADELPRLLIEISVLSPFVRIQPEDVRVGEHGLRIHSGGLHGLLLPQVAVEQAWDREMFLGRTCQKAGLGAEAWRAPSTEIEAFTAEVFGEEE